jgi:hypothetical protein
MQIKPTLMEIHMKILFLRNHLPKLNETLLEGLLVGHLKELCPMSLSTLKYVCHN